MTTREEKSEIEIEISWKIPRMPPADGGRSEHNEDKKSFGVSYLRRNYWAIARQYF